MHQWSSVSSSISSTASATAIQDEWCQMFNCSMFKPVFVSYMYFRFLTFNRVSLSDFYFSGPYSSLCKCKSLVNITAMNYKQWTITFHPVSQLASSVNCLHQYASSSGHRAYCWAELSEFWSWERPKAEAKI